MIYFIQCRIKVLTRGRRPLLLPLTTFYSSRSWRKVHGNGSESGNSEVSTCATIVLYCHVAL